MNDTIRAAGKDASQSEIRDRVRKDGKELHHKIFQTEN